MQKICGTRRNMRPHIKICGRVNQQGQIIERIDLKFGVNSYLSFSDHMNFFWDRSRSYAGQDMGSKVRGGHPKLAIFDQNRYKIRFSRYEADFSHKGRSWGVESVKKILDQKIWYFGRKSKISTKILVIFNDFSWLHQLCDLDKNYFFGDLEHYLNNVDQIFFGKLKKNQNFWRISKKSHILGSKNMNKKFLNGDSHFFLLCVVLYIN